MGMSWLISADKMDWKASESTLSLKLFTLSLLLIFVFFFLIKMNDRVVG